MLTKEEALRLLNGNTDLQKLGAHGGSILYNDNSAHTGLAATTVYIREATVIASLTGITAVGTTQDFLTLFNISGATLNLGDLFIAPSGYRISAITLTSGSVILYQ